MRSIFLAIFLTLSSCVWATHSDPEFTTIQCDGMSKRNIHNRIETYIVETLQAEICVNNQHKMLAYVVAHTKNCQAVVYTIKVFIYDEEFHYALYVGKSQNDLGEYCTKEINVQLEKLRTELQQIAR